MKRFFISAVVIIAVFLLGVHGVGASLGSLSPFTAQLDHPSLEVKSGESFELRLMVRVPAEHYLYADKLDIIFESLEGVRIDEIRYPDPVRKWDPFLAEEVEIFSADVSILIRGHVPTDLTAGKRELLLQLALQGCTPKLCLRPEERELLIELTVLPGELLSSEQASPQPLDLAAATSTAASVGELIRTADFFDILARGFLWTLLIVFAGGIVTSLTPCVWPLIPVVLLIVGIHPEHRWWKNLLLSLSLVLGMILVYALLGLAAVSFGKGLGFLFQNQIFLIAASIIFLAMALSMFGLFDLHLPRGLQHRLHALGGKGYRGAFLAGMGTGVVASPCVGPVVASLLAYVALQRDYALGFLLLCVYGFGMGIFFIILGTLYAALADRLRSGRWMGWVKRGIGMTLLIPALFYGNAAVGGKLFDRLFNHRTADVGWISSIDEGLVVAQSTGKPLLIDFYADWCPPCREYDRLFFTRDDVQQLAGRFVMVKVDATLLSADVEAVIEKYSVMGWPTILFLSPEGQVHADLTVNGFSPQRAYDSMQEALRRVTP